MATETALWICQPRVDPVFQLEGTVRPSNISDKELTDDELDHWIEIAEKYRLGKIQNIAELPSEFCIAPYVKKLRKLPNFFHMYGYSIFSTHIVDIFQQFDLDGARFGEVFIYEKDRITLYNKDRFFTIAFGAAKKAVDLASSRLQPGQVYKTFAGINVVTSPLAPDALSVRRDVVPTLDLWTDVSTPGAFFLSNKLVNALHQAGLANVFALTSCVWL